MSLSIGIVGLPNVGKSTLFNALTHRSVPAENYPFCTIDPSVGIVAVPDARLLQLSDFSHSEKTIPAVVEFTDIAGLVEGASSGEGLGNKFLSHIREVDVIVEVVRAFDDKSITHVHGRVNPLHDIDVINLELILADLQTVSKRRATISQEIKKGDKDAVFEDSLLKKIESVFEDGKLARTFHLTKEERKIIKLLGLLSIKPILYVLNFKTSDGQSKIIPQELQNFFESANAQWISFDILTEEELKNMEDKDKESFREEFGVMGDGLSALITKSYGLLDLITFFTTGPKETRGWTVKKGSTAPEAGSSIHTDFRDKFIRAEIIGCHELLKAGSYAEARERGLVRTEGKEYTVKDGDVIEFKI